MNLIQKHARDLIRDLQKRANGQVHIQGVPHQNLSKEARLDLVLYLINAGRVELLEGEISLDLLLYQLRQFPNGKYDDLVDSYPALTFFERFEPYEHIA